MHQRLLPLLACLASACVDTELDLPEGGADSDHETGSEGEAGSDDEAGSDETGSGGGTPGPGVEPSPALLAEGCEIEVLWTMQRGEDPYYSLDAFWEGQHGAFVAGEPGEFVIGGEVLRGEEQSQVLLKIVDAETQWVREYMGSGSESGNSNSQVRQVVAIDDGLRVIGGFDYELDGSWMTAYSTEGELEWVQPGPLVGWEDAVAHANRVFATGNRLGLHQAHLEVFEADGSTAWDFSFDTSATSLAVTANDAGIWLVGYQSAATSCGWISHFDHDGQIEVQACTEVEEGAHEYFTSAVALADGGVIAAGSRYSTKPKDVGHIHFDEPLVVVFDSAGVEQHRWTPGEGVFEGGRIGHMVALDSGDVASTVELDDVAAEVDVYEKPVIYKHDADGQLLGRCKLDRTTIPEYGASPVALAVDSSGDLFLLLSEFQVISSMPNDDPSEFPPVPEDFGGYSIVRIVAFN